MLATATRRPRPVARFRFDHYALGGLTAFRDGAAGSTIETYIRDATGTAPASPMLPASKSRVASPTSSPYRKAYPWAVTDTLGCVTELHLQQLHIP